MNLHNDDDNVNDGDIGLHDIIIYINMHMENDIRHC